jgi:hypothetical protein
MQSAIRRSSVTGSARIAAWAARARFGEVLGESILAKVCNAFTLGAAIM